MAIVFNATNEEQTVKALGNWFTFKPKQYKDMQQNLAHFLMIQRAEHGFVGLPEEFSDPEYKNTPEGQKIFKEAEAQGIKNYLKKQVEIVNNNLQSLKKDLNMANIETDPRAFMSEGEMQALKLLDKYRQTNLDEDHKKVQIAEELQRKLGLK